ncbi:discoidin domain-containing protein, partial [Arthrobacter sp. Cr_A7]|uniref:discoidin domain-containing protein n=1 Tax=Arthrobacter sp. Cr_A7 TaxID=3031017 RepID=UPI0023DB2781
MLRTGWTVTASDEESTGENGQATNVLDGDSGTYWHSKWTAPSAPLPHSITIDTKAIQQITGLLYRPRSVGSNGRIGSFDIAVSTNGNTWGSPVARGT